MKNYICLDGKKIELTEKQVEEIRRSVGKENRIRLSEVPAGETFTVGNHRMIVLEHRAGVGTYAICAEFIREEVRFGENNNYNGSEVDEICCEFAEELSDLVGEENLIRSTLDLTSDDGLDDYGTVDRYAALITADMYRRYVKILDKHKPEKWWWLATPYSTPTHENADFVKCVSPSGSICSSYSGNSVGVRPFCIFDSNIFVS